MKISMTTAALLILVVYVLYLTQCRQSGTTGPSTRIAQVDTNRIIEDFRSSEYVPKPDTTIRYKVKFVPVHDTTKVPTPVYVDREVKVPATIDTMTILADYFAKRSYRDSLATKYGRIYVNDTVSQNRIVSRVWQVQFNTPIVTRYPREFTIGGGLYNSKVELVSAIRLDLGYKNRQGQEFGISEMRTGGNWNHGVTFHQTLGRRH